LVALFGKAKGAASSVKSGWKTARCVSVVNSVKMLRSNPESIVDSRGARSGGRISLAKNKPAFGRLGAKRQCLACGAKYYDLGRKPAVCSRCGAKAEAKLYHRHTGYPGGIRTTSAGKMRAEKPERLIETAVRGMLPKNRLGRRLFTKLKVYRSAEHPHSAQKPESMTL